MQKKNSFTSVKQNMILMDAVLVLPDEYNQ